MKRITRSAAAEPLPLQTVNPLKKSKSKEDAKNDKWQLVSFSSSNSAKRFGLPDGWRFHEVPRGTTTTTPQRVDRYYIEPGSGQKFRSLLAVRRYLSDGQVPRQETVDKQSTIGRQYYVEPGTGRRFRSLVAVERYLTEENEDSEPAPLQALVPVDKLIVSSGTRGQKKKILPLKIVSKNSSHLKDCSSTPPPNTSGRNTCTLPSENLNSPKEKTPLKTSRTLQINNSSRPPKVKWVLVDRVENEWTPFIDNSKVLDSIGRSGQRFSNQLSMVKILAHRVSEFYHFCQSELLLTELLFTSNHKWC